MRTADAWDRQFQIYCADSAVVFSSGEDGTRFTEDDIWSTERAE
jgi:hypothetical protein